MANASHPARIDGAVLDVLLAEQGASIAQHLPAIAVRNPGKIRSLLMLVYDPVGSLKFKAKAGHRALLIHQGRINANGKGQCDWSDKS